MSKLSERGEENVTLSDLNRKWVCEGREHKHLGWVALGQEGSRKEWIEP